MIIETLNEANVEAILASEGGNGWKRDPSVWAERLRNVNVGDRVVLVAMRDGRALGYGSLLWQSAHKRFASQGIPEIHDVVTANRHRHMGVASTIIASLEEIARQRGKLTLGIGVGLYADYAAAQRLYVGLGYVPDGFGVTYAAAPIEPGKTYIIDDDLILWLIKTLK